jgi:trigger factor
MNISKEVKGDLTAVLKIQITKGDYEPRVEKVLEDYRKKARIDGFRPGKVPAGIVRKMYGKSIMADEINKLLSENIMKYIQDEQIHILGEPIPSEKEQKPIDWENDSDFEFAFDLGLTPEFELKLSKKEKFIEYAIDPDNKLIDTYKDNYARRYGAFKICDSIEDGKEMIKGTVVELNEDGSLKEGGISVTDATLYLEFLKDEDTKKQFDKAKAGSVLSFNLRKAYPNDVELASILKIKKEQAVTVNSDFQLTIDSISKFEKAELNQELFDKIYGEGNVTTDEQFVAKISEEISHNLSRETDYKFRLDAKEKMLGKAEFALPIEFLKRWIYSSNEGKFTKEQIDEDFPKFERDLKWQLIQNKIIKENDLKVSDEEILDFAKVYARMQFEQYGLFTVPEEHILNFAQESLKREDERRRLFERKYEDKVLEFVKESVTIESKKISPEEFDKLFEENK